MNAWEYVISGDREHSSVVGVALGSIPGTEKRKGKLFSHKKE
jgi:hypothetical protein